MSKKIGIDIDETIAASFLPILEHVNACSWRTAAFEDLIHHDWWDIPHIQPPFGKEEIVWYFQSFDIKFADHHNILPISWSQEVLQSLQSRGYELVAITGRNEEYSKAGTNRWIMRHFPDLFTSVHFTNHISTTIRKNKSTICKELAISCMIEDNIDFALELAHNGIASFLLEKPWNKQRTDEHPLITRVKNWDEIRLHFA